MPESITQFYKRIQSCDLQPDATYSMEKPYFNIFSRQCNFGTVQFGYREFYKITLIIGVGKLYYADKWILVDRPALLFSNPLVPYAWESISEEQKGVFCIFNEQFVQSDEKNGSLANTPLFKVTGDKVFFLDDVQVAKVMDIYKQMQEENQSDYINKSDVLRCYLHLLVHTALKMQDSNQYESHPNASQRITELFIEGNYILLCTISKTIKGHITMYPFIIQSFFSFFFPFPSFLTLQERVFRKRGSRGSIFGL